MKSILLFILSLSFLLITGCEETTEVVLTDKEVTLLSPVGNLVSNDSIQLFYWESLQGTVKYRMQIVSPKFDSIVKLIADTLIVSNKFTQKLNPGKYQWRVRAENNSTVSKYSMLYNLTIQ